jgi:hypothetical protein
VFNLKLLSWNSVGEAEEKNMKTLGKTANEAGRSSSRSCLVTCRGSDCGVFRRRRIINGKHGKGNSYPIRIKMGYFQKYQLIALVVNCSISAGFISVTNCSTVYLRNPVLRL